MSLDLITLIEGDLSDIGDTMQDVTAEVLQQFEQQQHQALGAIQMGLHELQIRASQTGAASTSLALSTSEAAGMLHVKDPRVIVLPEGALTTKIEVDRPIVSTLKGVGLNLVALPNEALHPL